MQPDFKHVAVVMSLVFAIIELVDEEVHAFLKQIKLEPYFATSWIVTWMTHDIKELHRVARLLDVMITSIPAYSLYLSAAVMVYFRNGILKCCPDVPSVHSYLGG
jgi:hypothetical protein